MAGRKLATTVHVGGQVFEAGSTPPKEFADLITNPKAWGDEPDSGSSSTPAKRSAPKRTTAKKAAATPAAKASDDDDDDKADDAGSGDDLLS
jgi:hypothetical protein